MAFYILLFNIILSKKTNRDEQLNSDKDKILISSTDVFEEINEDHNDIIQTNLSIPNNYYNNTNSDNKAQNLFCPYSIYTYNYKSKIHIDFDRLSLVESKIKIPQSSLPSKSNKSKQEQPKEDFEDNCGKQKDIDNMDDIDDDDNEYNIYKNKKVLSLDSYAYIKRFPHNNDYIVYIKDKFYTIYDIETGEKLKTQRTNDTYGYQGVIPFKKGKIFAVGADFLKVFNYNLEQKKLTSVDPNNSYKSYDKAIYVKQITSTYIIICKKTACYLYSLLKYTSEKIIYLKAIIKLLNLKSQYKDLKDVKDIKDTKGDSSILLNMNIDFFSNCKIFTKNEFGLSYKNYIFMVSVPEACITTYFDVSRIWHENIKKYMKRMNIFVNVEKEKKKYYFIWCKDSNVIDIYSKNQINLDLKNKYVIPFNNNNELSERHHLNVANIKEELISFEKDIKLPNNIKIFNIKQCSNSEIVVITKNNEMLIYNFLCNSVTLRINYAQIILEGDLYFLKKIGKGMFLVNLINGNLGIIELKNGKILKELYVDDQICFYVNISDKDNDQTEKNKLNKNILILNESNILSLDI